jgi:hypothetical protein
MPTRCGRPPEAVPTAWAAPPSRGCRSKSAKVRPSIPPCKSNGEMVGRKSTVNRRPQTPAPRAANTASFIHVVGQATGGRGLKTPRGYLLPPPFGKTHHLTRHPGRPDGSHRPGSYRPKSERLPCARAFWRKHHHRASATGRGSPRRKINLPLQSNAQEAWASSHGGPDDLARSTVPRQPLKVGQNKAVNFPMLIKWENGRP